MWTYLRWTINMNQKIKYLARLGVALVQDVGVDEGHEETHVLVGTQLVWTQVVAQASQRLGLPVNLRRAKNEKIKHSLCNILSPPFICQMETAGSLMNAATCETKTGKKWGDKTQSLTLSFSSAHSSDGDPRIPHECCHCKPEVGKKWEDKMQALKLSFSSVHLSDGDPRIPSWMLPYTPRPIRLVHSLLLSITSSGQTACLGVSQNGQWWSRWSVESVKWFVPMRPLLLYLCYVFWALIKSLVCWFCTI